MPCDIDPGFKLPRCSSLLPCSGMDQDPWLPCGGGRGCLLSISTHRGAQVECEIQRCEKTHFCLISLSCPEEFLPRQGETLDSCLLQTRITLFVTRMACLGAHWKAPQLPQETSTANCTAMVQPSRERPASHSLWMVRMVLLNGGWGGLVHAAPPTGARGWAWEGSVPVGEVRKSSCSALHTHPVSAIAAVRSKIDVLGRGSEGAEMGFHVPGRCLCAVRSQTLPPPRPGCTRDGPLEGVLVCLCC